MAKAKVNKYAEGTWLEPYIGYEFEVQEITRSFVYFYMDNGKEKPDIEWHEKGIFDLEADKTH